MNTTQDYTRTITEMMSAFPFDAKALDEALRTSAALTEKVAKLAIEAAGQSAEISLKWTRETLHELEEVTRVREEPAACAESLTRFASASARMAAENMAAFADVARTVQTGAVELMLSAGRDPGEGARKTVKKATNGATRAAGGAKPGR